MPTLALGTWKADSSVVKEAVAFAIETGYRHIDCAPRYGNERSVGEGIKEGMKRTGIERKELYVTSKLWNTEHKPERILGACQQSLHDLGLDYLDLYLIHWPVAFQPDSQNVDSSVDLWETWEAMQLLKEEDLVRSLGVCNFTQDQLESLIMDTDISPVVNQIELHPYFIQPNLISYCKKNAIQLTAYSPLATGSNPNSLFPILLNDPIIFIIAKEYNKSPAQLILKWLIQSGFVPLPKSVTPSRIKENFDIFDFTINEHHMNKISQLNKNYRYISPEWASHFKNPK